MGNGWTTEDGAEVSRNSARSSSPNYALSEAAKLSATTEVFFRALVQDDALKAEVNQLSPHTHERTIAEEAARAYLENHPAGIDDVPLELPTDWQTRIRTIAPTVEILRACRPRG